MTCRVCWCIFQILLAMEIVLPILRVFCDKWEFLISFHMIKDICRTIKNTSLKAIEIASSLKYLVEFITRNCFFSMLGRKQYFHS